MLIEYVIFSFFTRDENYTFKKASLVFQIEIFPEVYFFIFFQNFFNFEKIDLLLILNSRFSTKKTN